MPFHQIEHGEADKSGHGTTTHAPSCPAEYYRTRVIFLGHQCH